MNFENFTGYVLAGGKSSRMKTDKAFLQIEEETFLERAVTTLKSTCCWTKIVLNETQKAKYENAFPHLVFISDIYPERGATGGIHAALKDCSSDWAIILAVDLPFVTSEAIIALQSIAAESKETSAVVPKQPDGRLQPLCAVYRSSVCLPVIEKMLSEKSSVSVSDFLRKTAASQIEFEASKNKDLLFLNINQSSDYRQINHLKTPR